MTTTYTSTDPSPAQVTSLPQPESKTKSFHFHDSQFLVLVNRVLAFVVAMMAIFVQSRINGRNRRISHKKLAFTGSTNEYRVAPLHLFSFCSVSNILSSWCQYEALKYVNFPTQVTALPLIPFICFSSIVSFSAIFHVVVNTSDSSLITGLIEGMQTPARDDHVQHHIREKVPKEGVRDRNRRVLRDVSVPDGERVDEQSES